MTLAEAGLRAGESASQLMHRLLAFSRHKALSPQVVAVGDLLQNLQPLMRRTMSQQVSLRMHWPAELWHALVDPAELESAILNLAINAQDAMPGGGSLTIEATNVSIDRVYAAVAGVDRTGDYIMIAVSDTGTGMPKEVMARAFDPFYTTKAPGKGTGLGLSMVYGFVRQSGGHVLIDSEPGRGSVVRMYLPRTLPPDAALRPSARGGGVAGGNETILLVEDNELVRAHTEAMLRGLGYVVAAAPDGPAAVRTLEEGLRPDLLLTDVILPGGMTGRDVAAAAQRAVPGVRVLFISGYSGNVLMENGRLPPGWTCWASRSGAASWRRVFAPSLGGHDVIASKARALPWTRQGAVAPWNPLLFRGPGGHRPLAGPRQSPGLPCFHFPPVPAGANHRRNSINVRERLPWAALPQVM